MGFILAVLAALCLQTVVAKDIAAATLGAPVISQTLINLPDNTVLDLGPFSPTIPAGENLGEVREVFGNSGVVYDQARVRVVFFGAGHAGSNYDAIWTFPLDTLQQTELYPPTPAQPTMVLSNWDSTLGAWISGPDGGPYPRPAARHNDNLIT